MRWIALAAVMPCAIGLNLKPATAAPTSPAVRAAAPAAFKISRANLAKTASFTVTQTLAPKEGTPLTRTFKIVVNGGFGRVDYDDPALGSVRYLANQQGMFLVIPGNKTATKYDLKGGVDTALRMAFQFVSAQGADFKKTGATIVSGQPADEYRNTKTGAVVYIGTHPGFRLPVKGTLANEGGSQSFLVSEIKLNIPVAVAQFALPVGTQVISGENGAAGMPGGKGG